MSAGNKPPVRKLGHCFIERFEGDVAVVERSGKVESRPRSSLPRGSKEGDVVDLDRGIVDVAETNLRRAALAATRQKHLKGGGSFDL